MKAIVYATWKKECFCPRPALRVSQICVDYDPIFRFKRAARKLAALNSCTDLTFSSVDKQAYMLGNFACQHHPYGAVIQIDWKLE